jgi:cell division protein ZapA
VSRAVKITVAGQTLALKTDAPASYVKELAAYVTRKMDEIRGSGRVTTQSQALLAAMNIADELFQSREAKARLQRQVRERTRKILHQLDEAGL